MLLSSNTEMILFLIDKINECSAFYIICVNTSFPTSYTVKQDTN